MHGTGEIPTSVDTFETGGDETAGEGEISSETVAPPQGGETEAPTGGLIGDGAPQIEVYPTFSEPGGYYTSREKRVELTAPEGYTIRYTTDGSIPDRNAALYKEPLRIALSKGEGRTIRAACFDKRGHLTGQVITHTYICAKTELGLHYTVMLSCDEEDLAAMYGNIQDKVERAAHAEILAPDGTRILSQDVGLRLFGGSSRALPQKSFKIIARKDGYFGDVPYTGLGSFAYPFFPERIVQGGKKAGEVLSRYDSLILRNGGNDSLLATAADPDRPTLLRDGLANEFVARYAPSLPMSYAHFAVVYLNGAYYGVLELRENQNEDYFRRVYGVDDRDVVVVKSELDTTRACDEHSNGSGCRFCGSWFFYETDPDAASRQEMQDWISLCQRAAAAVHATEDEYRRVFREVEDALDLRNALEYMAVSCYLCNTDWPHNNIRVWRYTGAAAEGIPITDGKWRFATRDMDFTMARYDRGAPLPEIETTSGVDMFAWVLANYVDGYGGGQQYADALYLQGLFAFLLRDGDFRSQLAELCRTLASEEAEAYLSSLYTQAFRQVEPLIGDHITRWRAHAGGMLSDTRGWKRAAQRLEGFIEDRPAQFLKHLDRMLSMYE